MGDSELEAYQKQFETIADQATALTRGLTETQFSWRPGPNEWSIQECLAHLTIVGQYEIKQIESAIATARERGLTGAGPFRYGFLDRSILQHTEPPVRRKFTAPRRFRPVHGQPVTAILPTFLHLQDHFQRVVEQSRGLHLARVKVPTPISRWLKLSLGMTFAQILAHERRHLEQARRAREHPQFPKRP